MKKNIITLIIIAALTLVGVRLLFISHAQSPSAKSFPYSQVSSSNGQISGQISYQSQTLGGNSYVAFGSVPAGQSALMSDIKNLTNQVMGNLSVSCPSGSSGNPNKPQCFNNGIWEPINIAEEQNDGGPGSLAATMWRYSGENNATLFSEAVQTFNHQISADLDPNSGALLNDKSMAANCNAADSPHPSEGCPVTQFIGNELLDIYLNLEPALDSSTKASWQSSINKFMDYMINNGKNQASENNSTCQLDPSSNFIYYTNGNQNLGNTTLAYKAWQATGNSCYKSLYEQSLNFTLYPDVASPPSNNLPLTQVNTSQQTQQGGRWVGRGLFITTTPTNSSCSNGAGYLTEEGPNPPGYDGDYTDLQLSEASDLYIYSKDPRALCLINLFTNQQLQHTFADGISGITNNGMAYSEPSSLSESATCTKAPSSGAWTINAMNGSRHDLCQGDYYAGYLVAALIGNRPDLLPYIHSQFSSQIAPIFNQAAGTVNTGAQYYRNFGLDLAELYYLTSLSSSN